MKGAGFRVQGAGCRVQGAGCRVQGGHPSIAGDSASLASFQQLDFESGLVFRVRIEAFEG